ncbi:MAG TPA: dynamin family protein [Candidatus Acidoferrales bacterium]|nr:dynamin family protein [Candidatus Acidoferrales bacterium]
MVMTAPEVRDPLSEALRVLASLSVLPAAQRELAHEASNKLIGLGLYVAVIGEFKRGKSTLINALLDDLLLPTGVVPVTAVPTLVRFGPRPRARLQLVDGVEVEVAMSDLAAYLVERENPGNRKGVREAVIEYPARLLRSGITLIDTPGTGSVHLHNTNATQAFLPRVDVALLVLTIDAALSQSEADLLAEIAESAARVAVCITKADLVSVDELEEALGFIRPRVAALCRSNDVTVFVVSARDAIAQRGGGLEALRSWLEHDIAGEQHRLAVQRGRRLAARLLALAEVAVHLEEAAARKPASEAAAARRAFEAATQALTNAADEETSVFHAACRRAAETILEPRVATLRELLSETLLAGSDDQWESHVAAAADTWRSDVAGALNVAIRVPAARHAERLRALVALFTERAGHAFGVTLPEALLDVGQPVAMDAIHVDLSDEPGALAMAVRQARATLPGALGRRWRERARRERAIEDADRLAGRLRYSAVQGLDRAARQWVREASDSWTVLSEALAAAVTRSEYAAQEQAAQPLGAEAAIAQIEDVRRMLEAT